MVSEKFRYQLREELAQWQAEGIVSHNISEQLANRYGLSELDTASRDRFVTILLGLGSVLLGLAAITFVAANWQQWTREIKVFLLLSLFISVSAGGFYLWQHSTRQRLGQALLLLGSLILGANLGLMSQMFHLSGAAYQLYLVWSLGVLAMAYSLRITLLGILALLLAFVGYCLGIPDLFTLRISPFVLALQHMSLLASMLFIPLAYWCRSPWLFGLGSALVTVALEVSTAGALAVAETPQLAWNSLIAIVLAIPPLLLWAYQDALWGLPWAYFDTVACRLALIYLAVVCFSLSFNTVWQEAWTSTADATRSNYWHWLITIDILVLLGLTVFAWWRLGYRVGKRGWRLDATSTAIAGMVAIATAVVWWQINMGALGAIATFTFNLLLAGLAIGLIRESLASGTRLGFWGGIFLLVLQLLSRMLEYNTGLLLKSIVLFGCGVTVMAAGLWFERYVRHFETKRLSSRLNP
ncbi:MAG: DUF2157 domain-containing protein [Cyanophyceae cyanobacterium]